MLKVKHSELDKIFFMMTGFNSAGYLDEAGNVRQKNRPTPSPVFVSGGLGIGKSQHGKRHAEKMAQFMGRMFVEWAKCTLEDKSKVMEHPDKHYVFVDVRLSQKDPTDLYGLPVVVTSASWLEYLPHDWVKYYIQPKAAGLLFLDEINQATPLVTGAAFQLIHDRECGGKKFSDDVQFILAGNREEDHANIFELSYPLRDRFREVELIPSVEEFSTWAYDNNINPSLIAFVNWNPSYLYRMDGSKPATPRSIAAASVDMGGIAQSGKDSDTFTAVAINVGEEWALQFHSYCECKESLDLKKIFANPSMIKEYDNGKMFALIGAITEHYLAEKTQGVFDACLSVLAEMKDDQLTIGIRIMNGSDQKQYVTFWKASKNAKVQKRIASVVAKYLA